MPQFHFRAADLMGNTVEGQIAAADEKLAVFQVQQMGYRPIEVQALDGGDDAAPIAAQFPPFMAGITGEQDIPVVGDGQAAPDNGLTATQTMPAPPAGPIDLTQPVTTMPAFANTLLAPTNGLSADAAATYERLEPWQRGGPVPQAPVSSTQPTVRMNANGVLMPAQAMGAAGQNGIGAGMAQAGPMGLARGGEVENERSAAIPYRQGVAREVPLGQRVRETLIYPIFSGVVIKDLAPFYRQFATLINAGLPLYQALVGLEANTENAKLKEIASECARQVQAGGKLSDVLAAYPWIFPQMHYELIRAAEQGGMLDEVLRRIADYVEHELDIRRLIKRETLYPKIVVFVALMILGRPGFAGDLPAVAALVVGGNLRQYLAETVGFGLLFGLPVLAVIVAFRLFLFNIPGVRENYDTLKMSLPLVGNIVRQFAVAKFARTFAALYRGGFAMGSSLQIAGDACGNGVLSRAARKAVVRVDQGDLVSDALRATSALPGMALDMLRTGETTGNMDEIMDKMADYYEQEAATKSHMASMILGTVIFLLVAILVGRAIITQYMGMARTSTNIGE